MLAELPPIAGLDIKGDASTMEAVLASKDESWVQDAVFDARVQSTAQGAPEVTTIILRYQGRFVTALVEVTTADAGTVALAKSLTPESLVRVVSWAPLEAQMCKNKAIAEAAAIRIQTLALRSAAKPDIPQTIVPHGAPNDKPVPDGLSSKILNERLDNRLLDARVASTAAIFKLSSGAHELAVQYLASHDFHFVPTPTLIDYEFPGEEHLQFQLPYFGKSAWLTQTGELHLGMSLAADLDRVYDFHTVFRREEGIDARHLTEFTMLEMVFALKQDWTEIMDLAENVLTFLIQSLQQNDKYTNLIQVARRLYPLAGTLRLGSDEAGKIPKIKFRQAKAILRDYLKMETDFAQDLSKEEEAALGRYMASSDSVYGTPTDLFFITHFPRHIRSFSIHPSAEDNTESCSFDILLRGQEIVTGCRLLHDHDELRAAMIAREHPIDPDCASWKPYVDAHRIGMPPWGGFGMGLNRLVQGLVGLQDIRETVLFPRDAIRLSP